MPAAPSSPDPAPPAPAEPVRAETADAPPEASRTGAPHRRPAPPPGRSAARLLSPPHTPPATPTGIPIDAPSAETRPGPVHPAAPSGLNSPTGPVAPVAPRIGPPPTASPELEASGEVLWTSLTPPLTSPVPVPAQREADSGPVRSAAVPAAPAPAAPAPVPAPVRPPAEPERAAESPVDDGPEQVKRVRVVLAERRTVARPVRTVVDVQEGTGVGEMLRSNLIGSQLMVALAFAVGAVLTLGMLPLVFAFFPEINHYTVLGIRLPWLLLGFLVYPFLLGLGWWHTRTAERVEQNFADHVQD